MGRHGRRANWDSIPPDVRDAIDDLVGSPVVSAVNQPGGFSPGPATRCRLANGASVFVKAVGVEQNPFTPAMHRREAEVLRALPADHPAPRLLGVVDRDGWVAMATEWIDGATPRPPLDPPTVQRFLDLVDRVAESGRGVAPAGVLPFTRSDQPIRDHWAAICDEPPPGLDRWSLAHAELLAQVEAGLDDAAAGDTLLHMDIRIDNVVFSDQGPANDVLVDWPSAALGAAFVDVVGLAPALHLDGGPNPQEVTEAMHATRMAEPVAIDVVVTAVAGYFTRQALLPPPPGLPTVRAFQAAQGVVARRWVAERLGLPDPGAVDEPR